jgi:hypothetical protein
MDRHTELCEKYAYLKSRKRLDLLKSRSGVMYQHLITKRNAISDNALNVIRDAYNIALNLEIAELEANKKLIEGRLSEIGGGL